MTASRPSMATVAQFRPASRSFASTCCLRPCSRDAVPSHQAAAKGTSKGISPHSHLRGRHLIAILPSMPLLLMRCDPIAENILMLHAQPGHFLRRGNCRFTGQYTIANARNLTTIRCAAAQPAWTFSEHRRRREIRRRSFAVFPSAAAARCDANHGETEKGPAPRPIGAQSISYSRKLGQVLRLGHICRKCFIGPCSCVDR